MIISTLLEPLQDVFFLLRPTKQSHLPLFPLCVSNSLFQSNRYCFNDGYHTSHHLNPLRHWRDHPAAFMKAKRDYENNAALVFRNIDYLMMTYRILRKDYLYLADCMVPIGPEQLKLSRDEKAELLRSKTRRFSEEEIREKFGRKNTG